MQHNFKPENSKDAFAGLADTYNRQRNEKEEAEYQAKIAKQRKLNEEMTAALNMQVEESKKVKEQLKAEDKLIC